MIAVSPSSPSVPAVCAVEWRGAVADAVVETHDQNVGQTFRSATRRCDERLQDSRAVLHDTLDAVRTLGAALLKAKGDGAPLEEAVAVAGGWQKLEGVVAAAEQLSDTMSADPLAHVVQGWPRFRRYAPRMLRALDIQASGAGEPILAALRAIGGGSHDMPRTFLRRNSCAAIPGGIGISTLARPVIAGFGKSPHFSICATPSAPATSGSRTPGAMAM